MTKAEALKHISNMLMACQKIRSTMIEDGLTEDELGLLMPWVSGRKNIIPILANVIDTERLSPSDFFNFMSIAHRFFPAVMLEVELLGGEELPEPDTHLIARGWTS